MALTDFCPFKSPGEALFSPSLHISGASPPFSAAAALATAAPASSLDPPSQNLPPEQAPEGTGVASALQRGACIQPSRKAVGSVGSQRCLRPGSLEMGHSWSSLENWEKEGKEPAGDMSWRRARRGQSPAPLTVQGCGHRGHLMRELQPSPSQGTWGSSDVRVPPSAPKPCSPGSHSSLSPRPLAPSRHRHS